MNYSLQNIRITGHNKEYYLNQLSVFAARCCLKPGIKRVEFGKQDTRGAVSICLATDAHCISAQKHFDSKAEMLGFVVGFNEAHSGYSYFGDI